MSRVSNRQATFERRDVNSLTLASKLHIHERTNGGQPVLTSPSRTGKMRLSIIVPLCNEEPSIEELKDKLLLLQDRVSDKYHVEYCLVDDGSTDGTRMLMASVVPPGATCQLSCHERNRGVGAAIRTGLALVTGRIVCTIDADCSYRPEDLVTLIDMVASGDADVAVASPYHPKGAVMGVPYWRLLLSQQCSRLYRLVSPLKLYTYTSIFRAYSQSAAKDMQFESDGFVSAVEMLLCAYHKGYSVREAPMVLFARQSGYSKLRIAQTVLSHFALLSRAARSSLMKVFVQTLRLRQADLTGTRQPSLSAPPSPSEEK
jgi:dolichol-phosphate mannosyltransferase